jgi:hypothetical protein
MLIRNCVLAAALVWTTAVLAQSPAQPAHAYIVNGNTTPNHFQVGYHIYP